MISLEASLGCGICLVDRPRINCCSGENLADDRLKKLGELLVKLVFLEEIKNVCKLRKTPWWW
jgi:hypothetical protein